ncbi:hypothetical protein B5X24_HaOG207598 [Helicoverpa armigera]|nr:hypothetical protein B5X24_HaOG207598 [Helicoverpa armigera]
MLLLLLYFVPLRISISQTTENSTLKGQLRKSLAHVNEMLADIEGKIDRERKLLSQIDGGLRANPVYMDYDITDIWWEPKEKSTVPTSITRSNNPTVSSTTTTSQTTTTVTVPSLIVTPTTPTLFPQPPPITKSTYPANWPFPTTSGTSTPEKQYVQAMKEIMVMDHHGYCSAFLAKLTELIAIKDTANVTPLLTEMEKSVFQAIESGKLNSMGNSLVNGLKMVLNMVTALHPTVIQQQASVAHYVIKHKNALMTKDLNAVLNYFDKLFNDAEGEQLFATLYPFEQYPDGGKTATEVSERMLGAVLAPVIRLEGKRPLRRLIQAINEAVQDMYPNWRAQSLPPFETLTNETPINNTYNISGVPGRRSLNYKRILKHFLLKHPRYLKEIRRHKLHTKKNVHHNGLKKKNVHHNVLKKKNIHHNVLKKNNFHHSTHKHQRHHKKDFSRRERHGHLKPMIRSASKHRSQRVHDTSESGAFYHVSTTTTSRAIKKNKLRNRRDKKLTKQLEEKEKQLRYLQEKQRHYRLLAKKRKAKKSDNNDYPKYFKKLALDYFRQTKHGKNKKHRRFMGSSSKDSNETNTSAYEDSKHSVENNVLRKIIDFSSYSDQEEDLRSNLNDALRHGNATIVSFRAMDFKNQSLWDMTSASDDEWVLKNNIYKVFEELDNP